jgi:hypothetical protein
MCKKILIVVEDSKASHTAIQIGLETAQAHGANVLFFSVLPRPEALLPSLDMVGVGLSEDCKRKGGVAGGAQLSRNGHRYQ